MEGQSTSREPQLEQTQHCTLKLLAVVMVNRDTENPVVMVNVGTQRRTRGC